MRAVVIVGAPGAGRARFARQVVNKATGNGVRCASVSIPYGRPLVTEIREEFTPSLARACEERVGLLVVVSRPAGAAMTGWLVELLQNAGASPIDVVQVTAPVPSRIVTLRQRGESPTSRLLNHDLHRQWDEVLDDGWRAVAREQERGNVRDAIRTSGSGELERTRRSDTPRHRRGRARQLAVH